MESMLLEQEYRKGLRVERARCVIMIEKLQNVCFTREGQLSMEIKGHDYNNGYSCALHDIRMELNALRSALKAVNYDKMLGDVILGDSQ